MINSHKELIEEIKVFTDKFDLIDNFLYIKDVDGIVEDVNENTPNTLCIGLDSITLDDEEYNQELTYVFAKADIVTNDTDDLVNAETDSLFLVSALADYLNFVNNLGVNFENIVISNVLNGDNLFCTISGRFKFVIKRLLKRVIWGDIRGQDCHYRKQNNDNDSDYGNLVFS